MRCFLLLLLLSAGCYAPDKTREAVTAAGFRNIETHGHAFFACGNDYTFATKFTATNVNGAQVEGVACCGLIMGCSLRF